ncbi:N-acylneuraminate-9-phosphatase [Copidosoma floridanum]|uniref:N-acylneuraminate-9-phosphatase n=1 Tax=Copidosoma floridanum TaxID=29053 RepID=UPI0006C93F85|nr:N-acylneuraminate-9-phosphatase [Copidosoma floridanum]
MAGFGVHRDNGPKAELSALFFDLDNTLIETRRGDNLACRKLAEELYRDYQIPEDQAAKITSSYLKQFRKCPDNQVSSLESWRTQLWSRALGEKHARLVKPVYERWLHLRYQQLALTPETVAMLRGLRKKYLLGLITNGPSNAQREKIHELGLGQYFDVMLVSGDLPWEKPQPRIFHEACRYLAVRPDNCIMVGDKLETDIIGGIAAGFAGTVWIPFGDSRLLEKDGPKPNYTIKKVTDLLKILNYGPDAHEYEDSSSNASDGM